MEYDKVLKPAIDSKEHGTVVNKWGTLKAMLPDHLIIDNAI